MNTMRQSCSSGLSTDLHQVTTAGVYKIETRTTDIPPSGLVVTLSQTGSTSASFVSPTTSPVQQHIEMNGKFNCQVGDILSIVLTSSAPADQPPNLIKTTINLKMGV
jgi:hypothetical protein